MVDIKRYQQQLTSLNRVFLHDNTPSHTAKPVCDMFETLNRKVLPYVTYSPDWLFQITAYLY